MRRRVSYDIHTQQYDIHTSSTSAHTFLKEESLQEQKPSQRPKQLLLLQSIHVQIFEASAEMKNILHIFPKQKPTNIVEIVP